MFKNVIISILAAGYDNSGGMVLDENKKSKQNRRCHLEYCRFKFPSLYWD